MDAMAQPSTRGLTAQMPPMLPVEIMDDIIGEASRTLDAPSISSIALASHAFRFRANKARFSAIVSSLGGTQFDVEQTGSNIRVLADVVRSGHAFPAMPGVCAFATSFSMRMVGFYDDIMPAVEDGNLAYILRHIFPPAHSKTRDTETGAGIRELSLYIYLWGVEGYIEGPLSSEDDKGQDGLSWTPINSDLLEAIYHLLRFSTLNCLCLNSIQNLTRDFLQGSGIRHLRLSRVSISSTRPYLDIHDDSDSDDTSLADRLPRPIPFESLEIDSSLSAEDLRLIVYPDSVIPAVPHIMFPCLTRFSMVIMSVEMVITLNDILNNSPCLESLSVTWSLSYPAPEQFDISISYSHLVHLQSISLIHDAGTHLSYIPRLLKCSIPSSLTKLQILFLLDSRVARTTRLLQKVDINALDSFLSLPSFSHVKHIVLGLIIDLSSYQFRGNVNSVDPRNVSMWRKQLSSKVPILLEQHADRLEITVTTEA